MNDVYVATLHNIRNVVDFFATLLDYFVMNVNGCVYSKIKGDFLCRTYLALEHACSENSV